MFGSIVGGIASGIGSLIGGNKSAKNASKLQQMNIQTQKEFAQNGIRWKVADAKAAGIHPLYALGATTPSFSPVSGYTGDNGISEAANQFSQGISRAVQARMTREEREREQARQEMQDVFQLARWQQEQRKGDAEIRLIDSEIARNKVASDLAVLQASRLPATPSSSSPTLMTGQGDAPSSGTKDNPYWDASIPEVGFSHDPSGKKTQIIASDPMSSRTEDKFIIEWMPWYQAAKLNFRAKVLGKEVNGYWWHADRGEFLPYPPKKRKSSGFDAQNWLRSRSNSYY